MEIASVILSLLSLIAGIISILLVGSVKKAVKKTETEITLKREAAYFTNELIKIRDQCRGLLGKYANTQPLYDDWIQNIHQIKGCIKTVIFHSKEKNGFISKDKPSELSQTTAFVNTLESLQERLESALTSEFPLSADSMQSIDYQLIEFEEILESEIERREDYAKL